MSDKMNYAASAMVDWNQVAHVLADNEIEQWGKANPTLAKADPEDITARRYSAVVEWKRQMMIAVIEETLTPRELSYLREQGPWDDRVLNADIINTFGIGSVLSDFCDLDPRTFELYADDFAMSFLKEDVMAWAKGRHSLGLSPLPEAPKRSSPKHSEGLPSYLLVVGLILEALRTGSLKSPSKQNAIVATLLEGSNQHLHGISQRNIDEVFSRANKALKESRKSIEPNA